MKKSEKIWIWVGIVPLLLGFAALVLEWLSVSVVVFNMRLLCALGIFVLISASSFGIAAFLRCKRYVADGGSKRRAAVCGAAVLCLCAVLALFGVMLNGILHEKTVYKSVSQDHRHVLLVTADAEQTAWQVNVYRRYAGVFCLQRDSVLLLDMADFDEEITVEWLDDGCKMQYAVYGEDATSAQDTETVEQRFFFNGRI